MVVSDFVVSMVFVELGDSDMSSEGSCMWSVGMLDDLVGRVSSVCGHCLAGCTVDVVDVHVCVTVSVLIDVDSTAEGVEMSVSLCLDCLSVGELKVSSVCVSGTVFEY